MKDLRWRDRSSLLTHRSMQTSLPCHVSLHMVRTRSWSKLSHVSHGSHVIPGSDGSGRSNAGDTGRRFAPSSIGATRCYAAHRRTFFENRGQRQSSWGSQGRTSIPPPLQKENYRSGEGLAIWGLPGEVGGERVLGDSKERRDALPLLTLRNPGLSARPVI